MQTAAVELFLEKGFDETSVADITERADVTERTFYRHFGDKREVLFDRERTLERATIEAVADTPAGIAPLDAAAHALAAASSRFFVDRLDHARIRQRIIDATPELHERELLKMTSLADALAVALEARGHAPVRARLAADMAIAAFTAAFDHWLSDGTDTELGALVLDTVDELRSVAGAVSYTHLTLPTNREV